METKKTRKEQKEIDNIFTIIMYTVVVSVAISLSGYYLFTHERTTINTFEIMNEMVLKNNSLNLHVEFTANYDLISEPAYTFFFKKECFTFIKETTNEKVNYNKKGGVLVRDFMFHVGDCEGENEIMLVINTGRSLAEEKIKFNINSEALTECNKKGYIFTDYSTIAKGTECCNKIVGGYLCIILSDEK